MLIQVLQFLVENLLGLFALALLLRFHMQWLRAPVRNPLSQFLAALTDWAVVPARRFIPGAGGFDLATLILAWLVEVVIRITVYWVLGPGPGPEVVTGLILIGLLAALQLIKLSLWILILTVVMQAILTWVHPYSPAMPLLNSFTRPFLRVFQKRIPPVGNVDLSPLFVLLLCQVLLMAVGWLDATMARGVV
jgi:YggT family protein